MKPANRFFLIACTLSAFFFAGQAVAQNPAAKTGAPATTSGATTQARKQAAEKLKAGDYDFAYDSYVAGNYKDAFEAAMQRAEKGDPAAQTLVAMIYMDGRAVVRDTQKAFYWYGRAAEGGDPYAQLYYGIDLFNGIHVGRDPQKATEYLRKAAEAGLPAAYLYYGQLMAQSAPPQERPDIALHWALKGAAAGDVYAAFEASQILAEGTAKTPKNEPAARALLEMASNNDNNAAQVELAKWMIDGRGGPADHAGGFALIKLAAVQRVAIAQLILANCYRLGVGTKPDTIMAAAWYLRAKENDIPAQTDMETVLHDLSQDQRRQVYQRTAILDYNP